jgi:parallel beta-helix repeat protein
MWNQAANNAGNGVYVQGGSGNEMTFGCSTSNAGDGLMVVNSTNNTIVLNDLSGNGTNGLELVGASNNVMKYNAITGNEGFGLEADSASTGNAFQDNYVANNEDGNYSGVQLGYGGNNQTWVTNSDCSSARASSLADDDYS